jgi:hypothetical protein
LVKHDQYIKSIPDLVFNLLKKSKYEYFEFLQLQTEETVTHYSVYASIIEVLEQNLFKTQIYAQVISGFVLTQLSLATDCVVEPANCPRNWLCEWSKCVH